MDGSPDSFGGLDVRKYPNCIGAASSGPGPFFAFLGRYKSLRTRLSFESGGRLLDDVSTKGGQWPKDGAGSCLRCCAALSSITTPIPLVSQHRTAVCHVLGGTNLLGLALVVVLV